jgi:hypothetical protein
MKIKIASARLSFPSLFTMAAFGGESTGKYEATFILDKSEHAEVISEIKKAVNALMTDELKGKIGADKICLKDGDEMGRPEYEGKMTIKASTKKRPMIIDRDKSPIAEADNKIYAGCYVNSIVSLWAQSNTYGKRINAQLDGVQFVRDGEAFGDGSVSVNEFDAFGDDDDVGI